MSGRYIMLPPSVALSEVMQRLQCSVAIIWTDDKGATFALQAKRSLCGVQPGANDDAAPEAA